MFSPSRVASDSEIGVPGSLAVAPWSRRARTRKPLVPYCLAAIIGICIERYLSPPYIGTLLAGCVSIVVGCAALRLRRNAGAQVALLSAAAAAFGCWHHQCIEWRSAADPAAFAGAESKLTRVRGVVAAKPIYRPADPSLALSWQTEGSTNIRIRASGLASDAGWVPLDGRLIIRVTGQRDDLWPGDAVEAIGWLARPRPTGNPGEFDYPDFLRQQRIGAILYSETPQAVVKTNDQAAWTIVGTRDRARGFLATAMDSHVSPENVGIARAILLGDRSRLVRSQLGPFLESGTMHLLVVSGLHLVILARILWSFAVLAGFSICTSVAGTVLAICAATYLTGSDPPVMRAAVVIGLFMSSLLFCRSADPLNSMAAAAIVILFLDPADLFRSGPHLSFLCVLAIVLVFPPIAGWLKRLSTNELPMPGGAIRHALRSVREAAVASFLVSLVISLVTAPLVLYRFHLWSPVSILLSPPLILATWAVLMLGIALLVLGWVPLIGGVLGMLADLSLDAIRLSVEHVESLPGSYFYLPAPPVWWVVGFYLLLLLPHCVPLIRPWRIAASGIVCWALVGLIGLLVPSTPKTFEYHQVAVGHGSCALLRFPTGQNILCDCGSLNIPDVAERTVAPCLWELDVSRIDAAFVSHSDTDHFNGILELARRIPIACVYLAPRFAQSREPAAALFCAQLVERRIPVRFTWEQDTFRFGVDTLTVVQPAATSSADSDNSNSLVLHCQTNGFSILMPGDLEGRGLQALLERNLGPIDLLIAPHHGARGSNTPEVARRLRPRLIVSSQNPLDRAAVDPLACYRSEGGTVLRTGGDGLVSCVAAPTGIQVTTHATGRRFAVSEP